MEVGLQCDVAQVPAVAAGNAGCLRSSSSMSMAPLRIVMSSFDVQIRTKRSGDRALKDRLASCRSPHG